MRRFLSIFVTLAIMVGMTACGTEKAQSEAVKPAEAVVEEAKEEELIEEVDEEPVEEPEETIEESASISYPLTITDQAGREIVIEKEPETIVSGYYISSSLLIALELDDKLIGIEAKAGKRPIYKLAAKELIDLPSVGSAKEFDLEGCAALNADLVILPLKLKDAAATLDDLGIQTILVNPESEELLIEMIDIIAKATNTVDRAEELKTFITANKDMLNSKLEGVETKSVYLAGNSNVLSTAGNKMYQCSMIELAGGENVAKEIEDKYWVDTDYEQILTWNPDYIIIAAEAEYTVEDVLGDEALAACNAVENGNVYKLPSDAEAWDSPVPSGILGSVWLASTLHPDVISSDECKGIIEEFYETFYEFKYGEE
ncbi:MAG: ABC transporter substrate-binding protein [Lachnospiraceae bacterium]|nr:ABC transporter substrate-binding protein [Lachnospiraceae bacterium]